MRLAKNKASNSWYFPFDFNVNEGNELGGEARVLRRLDVQIPAPHHLAVHLKSLIISFLTVEHYVSVADAATAVLVFGKFN